MMFQPKPKARQITLAKILTIAFILWIGFLLGIVFAFGYFIEFITTHQIFHKMIV